MTTAKRVSPRAPLRPMYNVVCKFCGNLRRKDRDCPTCSENWKQKFQEQKQLLHHYETKIEAFEVPPGHSYEDHLTPAERQTDVARRMNEAVAEYQEGEQWREASGESYLMWKPEEEFEEILAFQETRPVQRIGRKVWKQMRVTKTKFGYRDSAGNTHIRNYWIGEDGLRYPGPDYNSANVERPQKVKFVDPPKPSPEEIRAMSMAEYTQHRDKLVRTYDESMIAEFEGGGKKELDSPKSSGYTRLDPPYWFSAGSYEATMEIWRELGWEIPVEDAVMLPKERVPVIRHESVLK